jgi:proteasome lid subunit RPN8/RPN11
MLNKINADIRRVVMQHSIDNPQQEVCGLILRHHSDGLIRAVPTPNVHPDNKTDFAIDFHHYVAASEVNDVIGCYHSHIGDNPHFSLQDIKNARLNGDWWILYHVPTNRFTTYQRGAYVPYVGRAWIWTYQNCFTLFQDFYLHESGHTIDDFYLSSAMDFVRRDVGYTANLPSQGLRQIPSGSDLQRGDLIINYNGCKHPNHCLIVTDPVMSRAIHHCYNELSCEINYSGLQDIHSIWRLRSKV